jgi:outer membrane protein OmpA-like peptidoglycan-associated protein
MGAMHDSPTRSALTTPPALQTSPTETLEVLRHLIFEPEQSQLRQLQERLDNLRVRPEDVSQVLPEAVLHRARQDNQLTNALLPTVEEAIQSSVRRNPRTLVEALFPLLGPAIRRAVAHRLRSMIASLNQTLAVSVSLRGVKWRLEALRTGVPFAEVVLLHTLRYRVEQVFLIHRQTGLLLQHVMAESVRVLDAEMIAGMLTAIQDFVRDSFGVQDGEGLETVQIGELTVWIESGPHAILACIIQGTAPPELKGICEDALAHIHTEYWQLLPTFEGDAAPFEGTRSHLEACIQSRYEVEERRASPLLWGVLAVVLCSLGLWSFLVVRANQRWATYLERLHGEPGIVVTAAEKRGSKYFIAGLRDPLAADPQQLLQDAHLSQIQVMSRWEPYLALDPTFVLVRAKTILEPPDTVDLRLAGSVLEAIGAASRRWINDAQWLARVIPGVMHFRLEQVADLTHRELLGLKEAVEQYSLNFVKDTTRLVPGQEELLSRLSVAVQQLFKVAQHAGYEVRLYIIGHADKTGSEGKNRQLSQERAERVLADLSSDDIAGTHMQAVGVGSREPLQAEMTEADRLTNRRVTLRVVLSEMPRR